MWQESKNTPEHRTLSNSVRPENRKQIPFGTKMYVVSNDGAYLYGFSVAEDTGGAIRQNRIDLYFETYQECINFGVRNCTVYILD